MRSWRSTRRFALPVGETCDAANDESALGEISRKQSAPWEESIYGTFGLATEFRLLPYQLPCSRRQL